MIRTTYIYILIDPITKTVRYVGKANNPQQRYKNHKNPCRDENTHKRKWINKLRSLNVKPEIEVIDEVSISEWKYWEKFWIAYFRFIGCDLVNYLEGGDGLTFGNKTSFKKGKGAIPVIQLDLNGNFVKRFDSALEVGQKISSAIDRKGKTCKGFIYLREETYLKLTPVKISEYVDAVNKRYIRESENAVKNRFQVGHNRAWNKGVKGLYKLRGLKASKPVLQYNLNGELIAEYAGCIEAAKALGCVSESIRRACIGENKTARRFKWKYKNNVNEQN